MGKGERERERETPLAGKRRGGRKIKEKMSNADEAEVLRWSRMAMSDPFYTAHMQFFKILPEKIGRLLHLLDITDRLREDPDDLENPFAAHVDESMETLALCLRAIYAEEDPSALDLHLRVFLAVFRAPCGDRVSFVEEDGTRAFRRPVRTVTDLIERTREVVKAAADYQYLYYALKKIHSLRNPSKECPELKKIAACMRGAGLRKMAHLRAKIGIGPQHFEPVPSTHEERFVRGRKRVDAPPAEDPPDVVETLVVLGRSDITPFPERKRRRVRGARW